MSSDMAASPGAGVLRDLAGWEGCTAPLSLYTVLRSTSWDIPACPRVKYIS